MKRAIRMIQVTELVKQILKMMREAGIEEEACMTSMTNLKTEEQQKKNVRISERTSNSNQQTSNIENKGNNRNLKYSLEKDQRKHYEIVKNSSMVDNLDEIKPKI